MGQVGADVADAHRKAHECDPVSAYGGVIAGENLSFDVAACLANARRVDLGDPSATVGPLAASVGAAVAAYDRGATLLRVHDVREMVQVARVCDAILAAAMDEFAARGFAATRLDDGTWVVELRTAPAFIDLYRAVWAVLREEVVKSQRASELHRG